MFQSPNAQAKMSAENDKTVTITLPDQIILEILTRLPAKSLSRFKCVSKKWLCIITTPHFITTFKSLSLSSPTCVIMDRVIGFELSPTGPTLNLSLSNPPNITTISISPSTISQLRLAMYNPCRQTFPEVINAGDGFLLFALVVEGDSGPESDTDMFVICNPVTRQWARIPDPPAPIKHRGAVGLATRVGGPTGSEVEFVVMEFRPNQARFVGFWSKNGVWGLREGSYMQMWRFDGTFQFDGCLFWIDLSFGLVVVHDPFSIKSRVECRLIELPQGCRRDSNTPGLERERVIGAGAGAGTGAGCVKYLEVEDGEVRVWWLRNWKGEGEWGLVYKMGSHEWTNNVPLRSNPVFFHPFESDVVGFVVRYVMGYSVVFVDVGKGEAGILGRRFSRIADQCLVMPFVIPSWPASLPPLIIAISEKDRGNEYFKEKKFNDAVDCYSRSIISSPTAVAYANRAAAYLKVVKYLQAESDCTDALNLDEQNLKAYVRRAIARKELGKLEEAKKDAELALKLAPEQPEILKYYDEINSMLEEVKLQREMAMKKLHHNHSMAKAEKMSTSQSRATPVVEKAKKGQPLSPSKENADVETQPMDSTLETFATGTSKMTSPSKETVGETLPLKLQRRLPMIRLPSKLSTYHPLLLRKGRWMKMSKEKRRRRTRRRRRRRSQLRLHNREKGKKDKEEEEEESTETPQQSAGSMISSVQIPIEGEKEKEKESSNTPIAKNSITSMETPIECEKELFRVDDSQVSKSPEREPAKGNDIQMSTPPETLPPRTRSTTFDFEVYKGKIDSLLESLKGKPLEFTEFDTLRNLITKFISHPQMSLMPLIVENLQIFAQEIEILEQTLRTNASHARAFDERIKTKDMHFQQTEEVAAKAKFVSMQGDEEDVKVKSLQAEVVNLEVQIAKLNADLAAKKELLALTSQRRDALRIEATQLFSKHQTLVSSATKAKESSLVADLQKGLMEVKLEAQLRKISEYQLLYQSL